MSQRETPLSFGGRLRSVRQWWWIGGVCCALFTGSLTAADVKELQALYQKGDYQKCLRLAKSELADNNYSQAWRLILIQAQLAVGDYEGANAAITEAIDRFPRNIPLRWYAYRMAADRGEPALAEQQLKAIDEYAGPRIRYLQEPETLTFLGRAVLQMGAEPKLVLDNFLLRARQLDPKYADAWLAAGELALAKHDYDLAARTFEDGLKEAPNHPDLLHGLARAYAPSDRAVMVASLSKALEQNTNHVPSRLLIADHLIDAEEYAKAHEELDLALAVNPNHPEAWAYKAVLAHLVNQPEAEAEARAKALAYLRANPRVDHLIGLKLSLKYRFKEGSGYQRRALELDEKYLPARIQLAQDLLRLGDAEQGWALADAVHQDDGYDVTAFNLVNLRDQYKRFATLTNDHFIVRMAEREAAIFGQDVLQLLTEAHAVLTKKYDITLEQPTLVEIFDDPRDFAVRTFGMPGNPGYLGVCFGDVITANSPSSPAGNSTAWASVLWHEYAHVITLNLTRNKMPRWLSEGISVYEELVVDPSWGQRMIPEYIEFILGDKMHPVSNLSGAFLTAKNNLDLQFAYYQSALVVEFLVKEYGFPKLVAILRELGEGTEINTAIAKHTEEIETIDEKFIDYARAQAREIGKGLDWKKPEIAAGGAGPRDLGEFLRSAAPAGMAADLLRSQPNNYWAFIAGAEEAIAAKDWEEAKTLLDRMFKRAENGFQTPRPYMLRAVVERNLSNTDAELKSLEQAASVDGNRLDVFQRLLEIEEKNENWPAVATWSRRAIGMNPFNSAAYRSLARSAEKMEQPDAALTAYETMLKLDPLNPAELHFQVASLRKTTTPALAKRHLLLALEDAPRFRAAHKLLLELEDVPIAPAFEKAGSGTPPTPRPTTNEVKFE
jgi:tetratricopeptide (TPR) repeat protein